MKRKPKPDEPPEPSLLEELRNHPSCRGGGRCWIKHVPADLVAQLQEIATDYEAGRIRCPVRIIHERFLALCQKRGVNIRTGLDGFRGVFEQLRAKA